ncbi:hypothetical protein BFL35_13370 [Clavibacter michiganensis]|nr:hypothetical protein BFL35_13370 [Clavibacter michiganensis]
MDQLAHVTFGRRGGASFGPDDPGRRAHHTRPGPSRAGRAPLYADRHPFAGGPDHRAAFLEDAERFKVELVADA